MPSGSVLWSYAPSGRSTSFVSDIPKINGAINQKVSQSFFNAKNKLTLLGSGMSVFFFLILRGIIWNTYLMLLENTNKGCPPPPPQFTCLSALCVCVCFSTPTRSSHRQRIRRTRKWCDLVAMILKSSPSTVIAWGDTTHMGLHPEQQNIKKILANSSVYKWWLRANSL